MLTGLALDYLNNLDGIKELVSNDNIARLTLELTGGICRRADRRAFDGGVSMFQMPSVLLSNSKGLRVSCISHSLRTGSSRNVFCI